MRAVRARVLELADVEIPAVAVVPAALVAEAIPALAATMPTNPVAVAAMAGTAMPTATVVFLVNNRRRHLTPSSVHSYHPSLARRQVVRATTESAAAK